jgi:hypothetical protein
MGQPESWAAAGSSLEGSVLLSVEAERCSQQAYGLLVRSKPSAPFQVADTALA